VNKNHRILAGAVALPLGVFVVWSQIFLLDRMPRQFDFLTHLRWAEQFVAAVMEGTWVPRWAYLSLHGLGDPTFLYYQPVFYYLSSAVELLFGVSTPHAVLLAGALPYLLLGGVVYFDVLRQSDARPALLGTLLVVASPALFFLSTQIAGLPWTLSIPFSVLFLIESIRPVPRTTRIALLLAAVCLTHLLSGLMALCCAGLGRVLFFPPRRETLMSHGHLAVGIILGLGLSGFFLFPALSQLNLINPGGWTDHPTLNWKNSFLFPIGTWLVHGIRWFTVQWVLPALALAMCVFVLLPQTQCNGPAGKRARQLAILGIVALALGSELAYPLFKYLAPMRKLQFPYRFVFIGSVLASIALALHLNSGAWRYGRAVSRIVGLILIGASCGLSAYFQWEFFRSSVPVAAETQYMSGKFGQAEYLPATHGKYWQKYVDDGMFAGECARLGVQCEAAPSRRTHRYEAVIATGTNVTVRLPLFGFPAWKILVDGEQKPLELDRDTGLIVATLTPGRHSVAVVWDGLPPEKTGLLISAIALCAVFLVHLLTKRAINTQHIP
jgi:hypothetical protein